MSDQIGEAIHQSINHVQLQRIQRCISGIGCSFSFTQGVQTIPGIEVIYHILHIDCIHHKANFCQKKKNIEKSVDQNTTCPSNTENSRYFLGKSLLTQQLCDSWLEHGRPNSCNPPKFRKTFACSNRFKKETPNAKTAASWPFTKTKNDPSASRDSGLSYSRKIRPLAAIATVRPAGLVKSIYRGS